MSEDDYDLFVRLQDAQYKVGKNKPLTGEEGDEVMTEANLATANTMEESKDGSALPQRGLKWVFESKLQSIMPTAGWDKTFDKLWRGVHGYMDCSTEQLEMIIWHKMLKQECEAARASKYVPPYLRAIYNERFPPTAAQVARRCPVCWEEFS